MDDELVEAIAVWVRRQDIVNGATGTWKMEWNEGAARDLLAAVREAGFSMYRPDAVERTWRHVDAITGDREHSTGPVGRCNGRTKGHEACGYVDMVPVVVSDAG